MIVNALALHVEDELSLVVFAFKGQFLLELLVTVWSEHHINGLPLSRQQGAASGKHLEPFTFLSCGRCCGDVWLVVVNPVAGNLLLVFEADLDGLPGLHADLAKVKVLRAHC